MNSRNEDRPGYKKTKVGWIPEEWDADLLENHSKRGSGHTPNKKEPSYYDGSIVWISLADSAALDNGIITESSVTISEDGIRHSSAVLHPRGTVLLSRDAGVGKSAIAGCDLCVSQHFIAWVCNETTLHNWFLYWHLQQRKREFERIAVESTIKTIGLPYFKRYPIPLPSLPEQEAIAEVLECWDRAIRVVKLCKHLNEQRLVDRALVSQLIRAGTSIGANVEEAQSGQSRADFLSKISIACKEARETHYWLRLIAASEEGINDQMTEIIQEANEIVSVLTSIVKNTKANADE